MVMATLRKRHSLHPTTWYINKRKLEIRGLIAHVIVNTGVIGSEGKQRRENHGY